MRLIPVNNLPTKRRTRHRVQDLIDEFMRSDAKIVKLDFNDADYKTPTICSNCMRTAIKRSGHYSIKVALRDKEVYLYKGD